MNRRHILEELEKVNSINKDQIKSEADISNDFARLTIIHNSFFWFNMISLIIVTCLTVAEVPLLILNRDKIWINLIVASLVMIWSFTLYLIFSNQGISGFEYDDIYYNSGRNVKRIHEVRYLNYKLVVISLSVCVFDFLLFYGAAIDMMTGGDHVIKYERGIPIFAALSITMPAMIIPLVVQFINRYITYDRRMTSFNKWLEMNGISKLNYLSKINYEDENFTWKEVATQLELNANDLILDTSSENKSKEQINLYNQVKVKIIKEMIVQFNNNMDKKYQLYQTINAYHDKQGRISYKKTLRNRAIISKVKRLDRKNEIMALLLLPYFDKTI